jgi:DegV family protein with EDD domain
MNIKIITDSASDLTSMEGIDMAYAPMKVCTAEREFTDDDGINAREMVDFLYSYKGRSSSSCPNAQDWLTAFGDAENIVCITITGGLSGSYNSALSAKTIYEGDHPDRRVLVVDSLTAGPEMALMAERVRDLALEGKNLEEIEAGLKTYKTELLFALESLRNFANNGRVSKAAAAAAGLLGIRAIGRASDVGTLELLSKTRGEAKTLDGVMGYLKELGCNGGKIYIDHCFAEETVRKLAAKIKTVYPDADIVIRPTRGLCSFYAELGGFLVGFEANQ